MWTGALRRPCVVVSERRESEVEESTHSAGRRSAMETDALRMRSWSPLQDTQSFYCGPSSCWANTSAPKAHTWHHCFIYLILS